MHIGDIGWKMCSTNGTNEYWNDFGISNGSIGFWERELNSDSEKLTGYYEISSNHKEK